MVSLVSLLGDILSLRGGIASSSRRRSARDSSNRRRKYSACFGFMNSSSAEGWYPGGSSTAISFTSAPESTTRGSCEHCIAIANGRALGDAANPSALVGHD